MTIHRMLIALPDGQRRWCVGRVPSPLAAERIALERFPGAQVLCHVDPTLDAQGMRALAVMPASALQQERKPTTAAAP